MFDPIYLMWLHLKQSISPAKARSMIERLGSAEKVYLSDKTTFQEMGITNSVILRELMDKSIKKADQQINMASQLGIKLICFGADDYPEILYEIPDPPLILYVRGEASVLQRRNIFCIVGTRRSTAYGMSAAIGIAEQLARCGMIIISGVAMGIDSAAHRGAVRGEGKTIGVMGCGLDIEYPSENFEVRKSIIENGALISEFPIGTPPIGSNFPRRNRILSALSLGVAVMEASERSGALITAKYAAEQGRDVFALPGNISNPMSAGTNRLIQDGASIITGADDIIAEYLLRYPEFFPLHELTEDNEQLGPSSVETTALQNEAVTNYEKSVLAVLNKEPMHVNEIVRLTSLAVKDVQSMITILQIKGKIKEYPGNQYSI